MRLRHQTSSQLGSCGVLLCLADHQEITHALISPQHANPLSLVGRNVSASFAKLRDLALIDEETVL
jgi:hypothetical protein